MDARVFHTREGYCYRPQKTSEPEIFVLLVRFVDDFRTIMLYTRNTYYCSSKQLKVYRKVSEKCFELPGKRYSGAKKL